MAEEKEHWMQDVHPKKGALRKELHIKAGRTIPLKTLQKDAKAPGKLGKRARLAEVYRKASHKKD
jgi:hypothetical protein